MLSALNRAAVMNFACNVTQSRSLVDHCAAARVRLSVCPSCDEGVFSDDDDDNNNWKKYSIEHGRTTDRSSAYVILFPSRN